MSATETKPMAKKKPEGSEPPTRAVKIDRKIAGRAEMVAKDKGLSLAEYISEALRAVVDRDWARMLKTLEDPDK